MTKHRAYFLKTWRTDNRHRGGCPFCHIYDHAQLSLIYAFPGSDNGNTPLIGAVSLCAISKHTVAYLYK